MAALTFPSNPTLNQTFTSGDRSWKFNGVAWQLMPRTTDNIAEGTTNLYFTNARVASAPAVTTLQSDLASEVSTRESEISRLDTRVDNVLENLDPVKIDSFTEVLSKLTSDKGELSDAIIALGTSAESVLGVERDARIAADDSLRSDLNSEISRAQGVETTLSTSISAEVTARQQAITAEQNSRAAAITAEQNARAAAISAEQSARQAAITSVTNSLNNEISRAQQAEQNIASDLSAEVSARQQAISDEASTRSAAVSSLRTDLNSEISRATGIESGLASDIASEASTRAAAITSEQNARAAAITSESTRAQGVEAQLQSDLTSEIANRETAVSSEATARENAITAERTARESDVASLSTRVDNVLSNVDEVALNSLTEIVAEFQSADSSLNGAITSLAASASTALDAERDARIAADDAISSTVSTLTDSIPGRVRDAVLTGVSFATNAAIAAGDSVLAAFGKLQAQVTAAFSAIDTEVSDRTSDVQSVRDALATEVNDRASDVQSVRDVTDNHEGRLNTAESQLAGMGTMSTQNANDVNITGGSISGVTVNAQSIEVGTGATADLFVGNDGKVGIGTEAPSEKLTVAGNIDILGGQVKNLGTPMASSDAATKGYVDTAVSGVQSALDTEISDRAAAVQNLEDTKQIKIVVSDSAPAHIEGREWLDTTDFRRYISIGGAWVENITA
jgi:hypothetical protein